jgi:phosphoribosylformylglycinamidine synthase subunit PurS
VNETTDYLVEVFISLKEVVNDPQGLAIRDGLHNLGFDAVGAVRAGKYLRLTINARSAGEAEEIAVGACEKLLANTVIEEYRVSVAESAIN